MNNMKQKILSLLVLLIAAASGAWADELPLVTITFSYSGPVYSESGIVTVTGSNADCQSNGGKYSWTPSGTSNLMSATVEPAAGYNITKVVFWSNDNGNYVNALEDTAEPYVCYSKFSEDGKSLSDDFSNKVGGYNIAKIEVYGTYEPPIEVTTNAEQGETYFTEASFNMPDYDATVGFDIVRDMEYKVAFSGLPARAIVKKDAQDKYQLDDANALNFQLLDNIDAENPKDITSSTDITYTIGKMVPVVMEGNTYYMYDKDSEVSLTDFLADLQLGFYVINAKANDTGDYGGICCSDMIKIIQGYEVEVPAKEFATYYKDEPLYAESESSAAAKLYTVSEVNGTTVTLSDVIATAPSNTPLLVYNSGDEDKTFLLIPADAEPNLALTVYEGFTGTLTAKTTEDTNTYGPWNMAEGTKYYGCNGNDFVWIKDAGNVAANRCWIEISTANAPSRLTIVFEKEEATGITTTDVTDETDDSWYDLSGRKLDGEPTEKGVYIKSGKKVIIK